jgi:hypothetical protein
MATVCFYYDLLSVMIRGRDERRRDLYGQRSKKFMLGGSIKEIHGSETAREYLDDSDMQRSGLYVLTCLNLGKGTFRSSHRMHLNAVNSFW